VLKIPLVTKMIRRDQVEGRFYDLVDRLDPETQQRYEADSSYEHLKVDLAAAAAAAANHINPASSDDDPAAGSSANNRSDSSGHCEASEHDAAPPPPPPPVANSTEQAVRRVMREEVLPELRGLRMQLRNSELAFMDAKLASIEAKLVKHIDKRFEQLQQQLQHRQQAQRQAEQLQLPTRDGSRHCRAAGGPCSRLHIRYPVSDSMHASTCVSQAMIPSCCVQT